LIAHLLVTVAKLGTRRGLGAVAAESLAVKHQLLIMKRAQCRAPNLTSWDRLVLGFCTLLVSPKRLSQMGCDTEAFHPSVLSSRSGEAQVWPALRPEKAPVPRTQRSVKRTHWRGYRDEAAKSSASAAARLPSKYREHSLSR
jgi:hypothetical protein